MPTPDSPDPLRQTITVPINRARVRIPGDANDGAHVTGSARAAPGPEAGVLSPLGVGKIYATDRVTPDFPGLF